MRPSSPLLNTRARAGAQPPRLDARLRFYTPSRLGLHQVAYVRALAEGVDATRAAAQYLGIEHGAQAARSHRETVELVRAFARRARDARWRLIGLRIPASEAQAPMMSGASAGGVLQASNRPPAALPSLDAWSEQEGLDEWSEGERISLYEERFGRQREVAAGDRRRQARNARLRELRLALLQHLHDTAVEAARPHDRLDGWFSPVNSERLMAVGALTLGDLQARIAYGGQWWRSVRAIGAAKAQLIAAHVKALLAPPAVDGASTNVAGALRAVSGPQASVAATSPGLNRASRDGYRVLDAGNDVDAIETFIAARCASKHSQCVYRRELLRYRMWLWKTRQQVFTGATVTDCQAYKDFLARVPASWMSGHRAAPGQPGWAPFRTQPTRRSQQLAITVLHAAHTWLCATGYLLRNPWEAVRRKLGDEPPELDEDDSVDEDDPASRAFTPVGWQALQDQVLADADRPRTAAGAPRMQWLLQFCEATGLRAGELLRARRSSFYCKDGHWRLRVYGKGQRRRRVPVPVRVIELTRDYFRHRGLDFDHADKKMPLLAAIHHPALPITYSTLAESFKALVLRAARRLPADEARVMRRASAHWLRHTHGTRAAERGLSVPSIQTNLGHADPRTATLYMRAQLRQRAEDIERAFG